MCWDQKTKRDALVLLMTAVLACTAVTAADTRYHLITIPDGASKVTDGGVVLSGMKVIKPALDDQGNPVWDSDGDSVADGYAVTILHEGPYTDVRTSDINGSLDVVGGGTDADGNHVALLWLNAPDGNGHAYTLVELGSTFADNEISTFDEWEVGAVAINDKGQVLIFEHGRVWPDDLGPFMDTFAWAVLIPKDTDGDGIADTWFQDSDGDGVNDLMVEQEYGSTPWANSVDAFGSINNFGEVAVFSNLSKQQCVVVPEDTDGDGEPDLWFEDADADGVNDLLTVLQTDLGQPMNWTIDISDSGLVLSCVHGSRRNYAVLWQINEAGDVEMVASAPMDLTVGVNNQGLAVGYFQKFKPHDLLEFTTILWRPDGSTANLAELLDNPGAAQNLRASDVNDAGCIVGVAYGNQPFPQVAFIALPGGQPSSAPSIADITPGEVQAGASVNVTITGSGFVVGATVTFVDGSGRSPTASVTSVSGTAIQATVSAHRKAEIGQVWDVRVTNPDGSYDVLANGFMVTGP